MAVVRDSIRALAALLVALTACSERPTAPLRVSGNLPALARAPSGGPAVSAAVPSEANQDMTLDLQVNGSGFDNGATVLLQLNGTVDGRVHVNSTRYVKSTQLIANVTIAASAVTTHYDVVATNSTGLKGIGSEMFTVTLRPEVLSGGARASGVNVNADAAGNAAAVSGCTGGLGFVWKADGTRIDLPLGSYCGASPLTINSSGVVMGSLFGGGPDARGLWTPSGGGYTLQVMPLAPNGVPPIASGLNDNGETVGWHEQSPALYWRSAATGWLTMQSPAGATLCGVFGRAINNAGAIVASCYVNGVENGYYYADHNAAPVMLPRPAGATGNIMTHGINGSGQIVESQTSPQRPILVTANGAGGFSASFLADLGFGGEALAIAEDGTVGGATYKSAGILRASVWYPNGSLLLLGSSGSGSAEALDVQVTTIGLVATGHQGSTAVRWRAAP